MPTFSCSWGDIEAGVEVLVMHDVLRHVLRVQHYVKLGISGETLGAVASMNWARIKGQVWEEWLGDL